MRVLAAIAFLLAGCQSDPPAPAPRRYADIPKIDVHVHGPAERASEAVRIFRERGVVLALNASGGHPGRELAQSQAVLRATEGRLRPYCNLDFGRVESPGFEAYARATIAACRAEQAVGLKIFKSLGLGIVLSDGSLLAVDDSRLDVVFEAAGEHRLPVLIHTGDPQAFFRPNDGANERRAELAAHPSWSFHGRRPDGPPWPSWEEVFAQLERRVAHHPDVTFVGAHFGNAPEDPERVARMLDRNPRYVIETGARIPEIGRHDAGRMRQFFMRYRDRVLFGTDFQMGRSGFVLGSAGAELDPPSRIPIFYDAHWRYFETNDRRFAHPTPIQGDWAIDGVGLPRDVLEAIYWRNAARVFDLELPR
ncbi:MAG: amidohydrolase family protein [Sandaracinaceae bacterium]|nr:amidohydrolase family protein [Sandaracinaceae bacterium]